MNNFLNKLRAFKKSNISTEYFNMNKNYVINLTGELGTDYNMISFEKFKSSIDENLMNKSESIQLFLDSPGGLIVEGDKIYNYLLNYKQKLDVVINGAANSMASIIALAGKKTYITRPSTYMIHLPFMDSISGNSDTLEMISNDMKKWDNYFINIYKGKCNKPEDEIYDKLKKETWFSASQAVKYGLVDDIWYDTSTFNLPMVAKSHLSDEALNKILTKNFHMEIDNMINDKNEKLLKLKALKEEFQKEEEEVAEMISAVEPEVEAGGPGSGQFGEEKPSEEIVAECAPEEMPEKEMATEEPVVEEKVEEEVAAVEDAPSETSADDIAISIETLQEVIETLSDADGNIDSAEMKSVFESKEKDASAYLMKAYTLGKQKLQKMKAQIKTIKHQTPKPKMVAGPVDIEKHDCGVPKFNFSKK